VEKNKYHWWWDLLLVIGLCARYTIDIEVSAFTLHREFVSLLLVIGLCAHYAIDVEVNAFTLHKEFMYMRFIVLAQRIYVRVPINIYMRKVCMHQWVVCDLLDLKKKVYCGVCSKWYSISCGKLRVSEGEVVRAGPERPNSSWLGQA